MDVHKKSWTVHIKTDLFDYKTVTMPPSPDSLAAYVQKHLPGHEVTCCYEAGCCGYWIARNLQHYGWQVKVVNPGDVPRTAKQDWQNPNTLGLKIVRSLAGQLEGTLKVSSDHGATYEITFPEAGFSSSK